MIQIGKFSKLEILKELDFGIYLDGGPYGELLLPRKFVPEGAQIGDEIEVFIYSDSEDRLIATTDRPKAITDGFAAMEVMEVSEYGAFLDWGIQAKDLLVPFRNQRDRMEVGKKYLVYVYLDEATDRIVGTNKLNKILKDRNEELEADEEVDIIVVTSSDLGYRVIINEEYWGLLYKNEVFQKLEPGDCHKAYVKALREDGRLDVILKKSGIIEVDLVNEQILAAIKANDGLLPLTDKSPPEKVYELLQMSKKNFKRAVGNLYKQRLIVLEKDGIRLL
ncbi:MAG: putative RNA-binding protein (virulence factor B family) [Saprospiraceae bacterium]